MSFAVQNHFWGHLTNVTSPTSAAGGGLLPPIVSSGMVVTPADDSHAMVDHPWSTLGVSGCCFVSAAHVCPGRAFSAAERMIMRIKSMQSVNSDAVLGS